MIIESIIPVRCQQYLIRVWRTEDHISDEYRESRDEYNALIERLVIENSGDIDTKLLIMAFEKLKGVSAIEVDNTETATGVVYYTEWP